MDDKDKYDYWLAYAKEDLQAAEIMLHAERWVHVRFCCQQAIEKLVKGLYGLYIDFDSIPRVHNITFLIKYFSDKLPQPITQDQFYFFDLLTRCYFNNRYPDYVGEIAEHMSDRQCKEMFEKTKEMFSWLQTLKP
jgi:HEPN domain-containing protein